MSRGPPPPQQTLQCARGPVWVAPPAFSLHRQATPQMPPPVAPHFCHKNQIPLHLLVVPALAHRAVSRTSAPSGVPGAVRSNTGPQLASHARAAARSTHSAQCKLATVRWESPRVGHTTKELSTKAKDLFLAPRRRHHRVLIPPPWGRACTSQVTCARHQKTKEVAAEAPSSAPLLRVQHRRRESVRRSG